MHMTVSFGPLISQYCVLSDSYLAGMPAGLQLHQLATWLPHSLHNHNNCLLQSLLLACLELDTGSTSITSAKMHLACETLAAAFDPQHCGPPSVLICNSKLPSDSVVGSGTHGHQAAAACGRNLLVSVHLSMASAAKCDTT